MKSSLEWATIKLLQTIVGNREFELFFTTMHHKAKLSQWISKEKSFPSCRFWAAADAHQCWHIHSSQLMRPLRQFCVCNICLILACNASRQFLLLQTDIYREQLLAAPDISLILCTVVGKLKTSLMPRWWVSICKLQWNPALQSPW